MSRFFSLKIFEGFLILGFWTQAQIKFCSVGLVGMSFLSLSQLSLYKFYLVRLLFLNRFLRRPSTIFLLMMSFLVRVRSLLPSQSQVLIPVRFQEFLTFLGIRGILCLRGLVRLIFHCT